VVGIETRISAGADAGYWFFNRTRLEIERGFGGVPRDWAFTGNQAGIGNLDGRQGKPRGGNSPLIEPGCGIETWRVGSRLRLCLAF